MQHSSVWLADSSSAGQSILLLWNPNYPVTVRCSEPDKYVSSRNTLFLWFLLILSSEVRIVVLPYSSGNEMHFSSVSCVLHVNAFRKINYGDRIMGLIKVWDPWDVVRQPVKELDWDLSVLCHAQHHYGAHKVSCLPSSPHIYLGIRLPSYTNRTRLPQGSFDCAVCRYFYRPKCCFETCMRCIDIIISHTIRYVEKNK